MIRIGIVGAGQMGTLHVRSALGNPLIQISSVCDINGESAEKLASLTGASVYTDIDTMLNESQLNAVVIATPDHMHADPVIKAACAGKAIMIEKPFATTRTDAVRMLKAINDNCIPVQMAHLFRFLPFYMNMKKAVASGELGDILSTNVIMLNKIYVPTKMLNWAARSSPSWFLLSHAIDTIMWINNCRVKNLSAIGVKRKLISMGIDTYDLVKVTAELENGAISTFEANWVIPDSLPLTASVQLMLSGSDGAMFLDTSDPIISKAIGSGYSIPGILEYDLYGYYSGLRRNMIETFARCVENHSALPTTAIDGFNAFCVLEAIDQSLADHGKQRIVEYAD